MDGAELSGERTDGRTQRRDRADPGATWLTHSRGAGECSRSGTREAPAERACSPKSGSKRGWREPRCSRSTARSIAGRTRWRERSPQGSFERSRTKPREGSLTRRARARLGRHRRFRPARHAPASDRRVGEPGSVAGAGPVRLERLFLDVATSQPLAILVDNLHRVDEASASLLASLASAAGRYPLLLASPSREGEAISRPARCAR